MIFTLEVLYSLARKEEQPARWLFDRDMERDYRDSVRFATGQEQELGERLQGRDGELFAKYTSNIAEARELEGRILFARGLAMRLELAGLGEKDGA